MRPDKSSQQGKLVLEAALILKVVLQEEGGKGKSGAQDKVLRKEGGRLTKLQEDLERLEARQALELLSHAMHVQQAIICVAPFACCVCCAEPGYLRGSESLL